MRCKIRLALTDVNQIEKKCFHSGCLASFVRARNRPAVDVGRGRGVVLDTEVAVLTRSVLSFWRRV